MRNISTALLQPELYESQNLVEQIIQILCEEDMGEMGMCFMIKQNK
jgi:hypothetical protein